LCIIFIYIRIRNRISEGPDFWYNNKKKKGEFPMPLENKEHLLLYIGSYTQISPTGISLVSLHPSTGKLELLESYSGLKNQSFLAFNKERTRLYAVSELDEYEGFAGGAVAAYEINPKSGSLTLLNVQPTHGSASCHLSLDSTESCLFVANYTSGSISVFPVEKDGSLGSMSDNHQHQGSGPNASRQEGPHAHSIYPDRNNRFALVADLGIDKVVVYGIDASGSRLLSLNEVSLHPGAGPRHLTFHPHGSWVYAINELDSTVTALHYDSEAGSLTAFQTITTLPEDYKGESTCAEIVISPDGRHIYASNRGHDSIAIYAIDPNQGSLTFIGHNFTMGRTPRNFTLTPDGGLLVAANQESDSLHVFRRDAASGKLSDTGHSLAVSRPVCVLI
jgi:6-phosphogluconolactonase